MFQKIIEKIENSKKIAILNHQNPDGDALGSAYALKLGLLELGKQAEVFMDEQKVTSEYELVRGKEKGGLKFEECDLKIAVDCADRERIAVYSEKFDGNTIALDHHITHIPYATETVVVPTASASGEIVFDLLKVLKAQITDDIAHNLYMAITCDTGSFKYSSTTTKTHMIIAELMKKNIDIAEISKRLFDTKSFEYLNMYKTAIENMEIFENGKICIVMFMLEDFKKANIDEELASGIVGLPNSVEGTEVGAYIRQRGEQEFKVSLRSNRYVDVAKIAQKYDGGGHVRASGFTLRVPASEVKAEVVKAIKEYL